MSEFWSLLSTDQKFDLVKQLVPILSIVVGAIISIVIFYFTKKKEIDFKVHDQRKEKYESYLQFYQKVFANVSNLKEGELPISKEEWMELQLNLVIYGSDKVLKKIVEMNEIGREDGDKNQMILLLGEIIQLMRKEVGLSNKDLTIRDNLSLFVTDIHDVKYDCIFHNRKVPTL